jgi:hypothetical protein
MSYDPRNPYQSFSSGGPLGRRPRETPSKVQAPAAAMMICGALGAAHGVYATFRNATGMNADDGPPENIRDNEALMELYQAMAPYNDTINITFSVIGILVSAFILFGGLRMYQLKNYGVCLTAAILAILPCIWICGCCGVGNGIGIWATVVLMSADVKSMFA